MATVGGFTNARHRRARPRQGRNKTMHPRGGPDAVRTPGQTLGLTYEATFHAPASSFYRRGCGTGLDLDGTHTDARFGVSSEQVRSVVADDRITAYEHLIQCLRLDESR